jgi:hypothetical protein
LPSAAKHLSAGAACSVGLTLAPGAPANQRTWFVSCPGPPGPTNRNPMNPCDGLPGRGCAKTAAFVDQRLPPPLGSVVPSHTSPQTPTARPQGTPLAPAKARCRPRKEASPGSAGATSQRLERSCEAGRSWVGKDRHVPVLLGHSKGIARQTPSFARSALMVPYSSRMSTDDESGGCPRSVPRIAQPCPASFAANSATRCSSTGRRLAAQCPRGFCRGPNLPAVNGEMPAVALLCLCQPSIGAAVLRSGQACCRCVVIARTEAGHQVALADVGSLAEKGRGQWAA